MTAPNFARLDGDRPEITRLMLAMLQARELGGRSWSSSARICWRGMVGRRARRSARAEARAPCERLPLRRAFYRLADEPREIILVACSKCDWKAAFRRADLVARHGADYAMPTLLKDLAWPDCSKTDDQWDRCGVYYVEPIEGSSRL